MFVLFFYFHIYRNFFIFFLASWLFFRTECQMVMIVIVLCAGKKSVKLEIYTEQRTKDGVRSAKQCLGSSGLELKLDELRKELSSAHGGILPHSVLSTEQIIQLASQKPNSLEHASSKLCSLVLCSCFDLYP